MPQTSKWVIALVVLGLVLALVPTAAAQTPACDQTYVVQAGDWLSTIAQKLLGDAKAYNLIFEATNAAAQTDSSFAKLTDPNRIETGQKLCIPAKPAGTPAPPATGPGPLIPSAAGIYTAVGPAADAPALVETLILTEDFKASYINDYVGKARITETGTWTTKDFNYVVTLTEQDGKPVHDELVLKMEDGNLVSVGTRAVTYTKTAPDVAALSGLYTSGRKSADGSETLVALTLLPNGVPQLNLTTANGDLVMQSGSWTAGTNADTGAPTVTVTINQANGQSIPAETWVFQVREDSLWGTQYDVSKWGTDLVLAKFKAPTEPETPGTVAEQLQALAGSYVAELPAADAIGRIIVLQLTPDNQATMTTQFIGKGEPIVETGTWTVTGGNAVVTLDTKASGEQALTFAPQEGTLVLQDPVEAGYGTEGLTLKRVPSGKTVDAEYGGVFLAFDQELAKSATGETLAAVPVTEGPGLGGGRPATVRFLFDGQKADEFFNPRLAQVLVSKADDWTNLDPTTAQSVQDLKALLASKPMSFTNGIPVLPPIPAAQVLQAKPDYLDFQNGSGIGFVTYYAQDVSPITADSLFYTFQGLTSDGKYYVAVFYPITTALLPEDVDTALGEQSYDEWAKNYEQYLSGLVSNLNGLVPAAYTPDLNLISDMIKTINIAGSTLQ